MAFPLAPFRCQVSWREDDHQGCRLFQRGHNFGGDIDVMGEVMIVPDRKAIPPAQPLRQSVAELFDQCCHPPVDAVLIRQVVDLGIADKDVMGVAGDVSHNTILMGSERLWEMPLSRCKRVTSAILRPRAGNACFSSTLATVTATLSLKLFFYAGLGARNG